MSYTVIFTPESVAQLTELYRYIAAASSPEVAALRLYRLGNHW